MKTIMETINIFRMIRSLKEKISWLYLQYTFVTGIYLLDPIEIYVFNMIALGTRLF